MTDTPLPRRKGRAQVTAEDVPPPIQWHEGMLLAPHHFQQQSARHELLVHYHAAAAAPFHWGVRRAVYDTLAAGILGVRELEAVLPDGLIVAHGAGDPALALDLNPRVDQLKEGPLTVHLAVVGRGGGLKHEERYASADGGVVRDENSGDELRITVLRPKAQLLFADEVAPKHVAMPIARIAYENDVFKLADYEPPLLRVEFGSPIHELCSGVAARLREKATVRAEQVRPPSDAGPQLLDAKIFAHCLVGELPPFEALLATGATHPFPLYLALCSLVGHVAGVGHKLVPRLLAPYDHNDLLSAFKDGARVIAEEVAAATHELYSTHRFRLEGDEFHLQFPREWMGREAILGVRAPSGVSDQEMASWIKSSVIATRAHVMALRDSRVRGVPRKALESVPGLVPPAGVTLYSIDPKPEHVEPGDELVIVNPGERRQRRPASIDLYVHDRRAE